MQLWAMLETLQSIPIWLFLCFALLLVALAWWQAPRIRPQLVGFRNSKTTKDQSQNNLSYWGWRLFYFFLIIIGGLLIESGIKQQFREVGILKINLPESYSLKLRWWQLGFKPLPTLVSIPAGKFMMGDEVSFGAQPVHEVSIPKAFLMSQHEVTFEQYDYFIWTMHEAGLQNLSTGSPVDYEYPIDQGWGRDNRPVINVSWYDAQSYVNWLSKETEQQCRLPTKAEWEFAARAGTQTQYSWGNDIGTNNANCESCGSEWDNKQTAPVGSFPLNQWGLQDMHGNVWEWVQDTWHDNYEGSPNKGEAWVKGDDRRVLRGGSWLDTPDYLRSAFRNGGTPDLQFVNIGFRVVCSPPSVR